jgi:hypothetical protein
MDDLLIGNVPPPDGHQHKDRYFVLAPELAAEAQANYLAICLECGREAYVGKLPEGAVMF